MRACPEIASNEMVKTRRRKPLQPPATVASKAQTGETPADVCYESSDPTTTAPINLNLAASKRTNRKPAAIMQEARSETKTCSSTSTSPRGALANATNHCSRPLLSTLGAILFALVTLAIRAALSSGQPNESSLRYDAQTSAYQGLTFTFDPRLDKQVEQRLHFEHWLNIMQQSSNLLYETLNGRAHLAEIKVLIPFKWRQLSADLRPVLYKPGAPVITNRRLRFTDSDVIVGFEDPVYKETPFALQHDECGRPGLNIRMPISFLDQQPQQQTAKSSSSQQNLDSRLKARQFVREFASHRFGIFKESGFRSDFMYPPFSSVAGLGPLDSQQSGGSHRWGRWTNGTTGGGADQPQLEQLAAGLNRSEQHQEDSSGGSTLRGFDEHFQECKFDTSPASGLPANAQAANCLPYLVRADKSLGSFNLMSADPFSYVPMGTAGTATPGSAHWPVYWDDLAEQTKWHFCGENFASPNFTPAPSASSINSANQLDQTGATASSSATSSSKLIHYEHNQRATNKQNKMCQERSALEVIRWSEDFRNHQQFSPSNFNRLPTPNFKFLQEMPPRLIMCIEYTSHLFQSRRLDHPILESAINKFLALDLIAESELATVVFGQHQSRLLDSSNFQKLDSSLNSRFTLFNPAIDPFDEQVQYYSQFELAQMEVQSAMGSSATQNSGSQQQQAVRILKGSCSFAKMMAEVNVLLQKSSMQYDDIGADLIVLTSGLFIEDEPKIDEILRSSNFKLEYNRLNMILYPSTMLFDTKSRDGLIVLDSNESEQIIRSRVNKLLLVQRLTGGKLHLIREQLDPSGDVKMSTLTQFYQIFDQLAKGHSWDQISSMVMIQSQQVDSRQHQQANSQASQQYQSNQYRLTFQFSLDESIQNELIVGFIDPKVQHQTQSTNLIDRHHSQHLGMAPTHKAGKRFSLKNLQLRSPGGQFIFTETNTTWTTPGLFAGGFHNQSFNDESAQVDRPNLETQESAFFPFRAQLSLAAFHVKPVHLAQLNAIKKLAGTWTLSALSDEPIQTSGVAMARANSQGDTLMGNCWIQTYNHESVFEQPADEQLKMVKVFVQTTGGVDVQRQEVEARMEVQDEMGNIVQNVQMLDDGLGAPDMTQNDGIHSQYVQRATRSGFYKVSVELTTGGGSSSKNKLAVLAGQTGQDNVCCGSFIPNSNEPPQTGPKSRSTRQLYCGTFFVEAKNKLAHQRPPRVSNLTVVNVDQENRRVTLRWFEPQLDISSSLRAQLSESSSQQRTENSQLVPILSETDLLGDEAQTRLQSQSQPQPHRVSRSTRLIPSGGGLKRRQIQEQYDSDSHSNNYYDEKLQMGTVVGSNVLMATHQQQRSILPFSDQIDRSQLLQSRYEIKVFFDREMIKRAFDSKHDVGFKFNEWSVEGQFPNASQFGGMKEVTLRVPFSREGFYFIAMKVFNNIGLSSQMSNIVQFYLRNNMTLEEVESIYGQPGMTVDAEGNVYDKNGDLVQRGGPSLTNQFSSYSLLKGTTALDGLSVLILISVLAFMMVILCITMVACLANSARHSLKTRTANKASRQHNDESSNKTIGSIVGLAGDGPVSAGSGSSMVSSSGGCESSEVGACSGSSSLAGSCSGGTGGHQSHDQKQQLAHGGNLFFDDLQQNQLTSYSKLQQQHKNQQQQAQMIHQQLISTKNAPTSQQQEFYSQPQSQSQSQSQSQQQQQQQQQQYYGGPNHTVVNGYTYATVIQAGQQQQQQQDQYQKFASGDLNQNGLVPQQTLDGMSTSSVAINQVQSWPADILLSYYDKVKQARERNEAPPVMRIETLEHNNGLQYSDGLPVVFDDSHQAEQQSNGAQYSSLRQTVREQQHASYYNQQLHQQLSSVLKSKRQNLEYDADFRATSPALNGIADELLNSGETEQLTIMPPPPPHYMYGPAAAGLPVDNNGLGSQLTDPSIYSQTTNLQPVSSPAATQDEMSGYYANQQQQQWPATPTSMANQIFSYGVGQQQRQSASLISSGIYSPTNIDQQHSGDAAISEV